MCPLLVCPWVSDFTSWGLGILVYTTGDGHYRQVLDKTDKAGGMEQWGTEALSIIAAITAIFAIMQNTGVITAPFMESSLCARHQRGDTRMSFWNVEVILSHFPLEET